jgi:predicted unusual protein kinase regulating ubiquinone biosynthesis (AarF/ABC1/UbiB family)
MEALRSLQSGASTFAYEDVRRIVEDAFEAVHLELFESFEEGRWPQRRSDRCTARVGGRDVAVRCIPDPRHARDGSRQRRTHRHVRGPQDVGRSAGRLNEMGARLREECDYLRKRQTILFGRLFQGRVRVPDVIPPSCRRTVLTTSSWGRR